MKKYFKMGFSLLIILAMLFCYPVFANATSDAPGNGAVNFDHPYYKVDETAKTFSGVYENQTVQSLLNEINNDVDFVGFSATIFKDDVQITEGRIEEGMMIRIASNGYSEDYIINELIPVPLWTAYAANGYGFTSPFRGRNSLNYISSDYGPRNIPGTNPFHYGIDISWSGIGGTNIYSVKAGTVTTAGWHDSFGNYVIVNHGNNIHTLYAHCSSLSVSVGNSVTQYTKLGTVGTTGVSTGNHLHFEVRVNGERKDPKPYLQGAGDPEAETVPEPDPEIYGGRVVAGDFDGNGYDDYACAYDYGNGNMAIWVFRSNGANFYAPQKWATSPAHDVTKVTGTMVAGDFNGDGLDDVAWMYDYGNGNMKVWTFLSNGSSFYTHSVWALSDDFDPKRVTSRVVAGDFDGNGYDDIACAYDYGNSNMAIWVFRSNGASFYTHQKWVTSSAHNVTKVTGTMVAGDFNGNGLDDVAWMYDYGDGNMKVWAFLSNGASFYTHSTWALSDSFDPKRVTGRVVAGDFDGNGNDDYACAYDYGNGNMAIWVFRSNGASFYTHQKWVTSPAHDVTKVTWTMVSGDFNGNGLDDIAWMYDYGNDNMKIWTFLSNGSSFYTHSVWALSSTFNPKRIVGYR